ncbi:MAG: hypothetical protein OHK0029_30930 [Armatimonadaceae bacterium]
MAGFVAVTGEAGAGFAFGVFVVGLFGFCACAGAPAEAPTTPQTASNAPILRCSIRRGFRVKFHFM